MWKRKIEKESAARERVLKVTYNNINNSKHLLNAQWEALQNKSDITVQLNYSSTPHLSHHLSVLKAQTWRQTQIKRKDFYWDCVVTGGNERAAGRKVTTEQSSIFRKVIMKSENCMSVLIENTSFISVCRKGLHKKVLLPSFLPSIFSTAVSHKPL